MVLPSFAPDVFIHCFFLVSKENWVGSYPWSFPLYVQWWWCSIHVDVVWCVFGREIFSITKAFITRCIHPCRCGNTTRKLAIYRQTFSGASKSACSTKFNRWRIGHQCATEFNDNSMRHRTVYFYGVYRLMRHKNFEGLTSRNFKSVFGGAYTHMRHRILVGPHMA
jgi:hypothetical protein